MMTVASIIAGLLLFASLGSAQVIYTEDFTTPNARSSNDGQFELGGNSGAAELELGQWVFYSPNGGINQDPTGDGTGVGSGNAVSSIGLARPMDWRGTNARAVAVILDPAIFATTGAGDYTTPVKPINRFVRVGCHNLIRKYTPNT